MALAGHRTHRASVNVLLGVFIVGGLLGPIVHRLHHGITWAALHADVAESCDHSRHGDRFEITVPDFLDEGCLLCVRQILHLDETQAGLQAPLVFAAYVPYVPAHLPSNPLPAFLIRGPPGLI